PVGAEAGSARAASSASTRGMSFLSVGAGIARDVLGEGGSDLRFGGQAIAQRTAGFGIAAALEPDLAISHASYRHGDALIATRDVVVGPEDRDAQVLVAGVVLQLPRFGGTDHDAIGAH